MLVYIIPVVITFCASIQYDIGDHKSIWKKPIWFFLYLYLVLIIGLRFEVGGDTLNYMELYAYQENLSDWTFSFAERFQPFYSLLCALAKTIHPDFFVFQILHSAILNACLFYFFKKNTDNYFTALLVSFSFYYFYFSTEILREALAIMIFILNYDNYKKGNWVKYYLGVSIAIMFHLSALFLIVLPFIKWLRFNKFFIFIFLLSPIVFSKLSYLLGIITGVEMLTRFVVAYEDSYKYSGGFLSTIYLILRIFRYVFCPLILIFIYKVILKKGIKYEPLICLYILLGVGVYYNTIIFERFSNYITPLYMLALSDGIVYCFKRKIISLYRSTVLFCCMIFFISYSSYYMQYRLYRIWIPYYSIFNPQHVKERKLFQM